MLWDDYVKAMIVCIFACIVMNVIELNRQVCDLAVTCFVEICHLELEEEVLGDDP